jgi:hypothetical protein
MYCIGAYPCPGPSTPSLHPVGALQLQPLHLQHSVCPHVGQVRVSQEGNILYMYTRTDKKENQIFLIYKEIQNGAVAKSYMTNGLLIYGKIFAHFLIY